MSKKTPNLLQKIARKAIRELINEVNSHKKSQSTQLISSKFEVRSSSSKIKQKKQKQSRHIPSSIRVSVLNRDGYKCVFCGRNSQQIELEIDHIIPFALGGNNDITNLQTLCFSCNRGKGARILD
jgi:5-methylcytosine-specific restriction endonuclease McrA